MQEEEVGGDSTADDLLLAFDLLKDKDGLLDWTGLLAFDEVRELLSDGLLEEAEVKAMWDKTPKAAQQKLDEDGFVRLMEQLDALFEDFDDEDEEGEAPMGLGDASGAVDSRLQSEFAELAGSRGLVELADVLRWENIRSLVEEGQLALSEVQNAFAAAGNGKKLLDLAGFAAFNTAIDDLFVDNEGDDDEAAMAAPDMAENFAAAAATAAAAASAAAASAAAAAAAVTANNAAAAAVLAAPMAAAVMAASGSGNADDLRAEFASLAEGGLATFDSLLRWGEVQELVNDNQLSAEELRKLWAFVPKAPGTVDKIDYNGFLDFNRQLDELFEFADDGEEDVGIAAAVASSVTASPLAPEQETAPSRAAEVAKLLDIVRERTRTTGCICNDEAARGEVEKVLTSLIEAKENIVPRGVDAIQTALAGTWRLTFASSKAMGFNKGITGVGNSLPGAEFEGVTQMLKMDGAYFSCEYTENLLVGGNPLDVSVKGDWEVKPTTSLITGIKTLAVSVQPRTIEYGFINLRADRWKPLRPMNLLDIIYLDDRIRVMRGQTATSALFIMERC